MYEILCSLGALLFQGVAAGLVVAIFVRRCEKKDSHAKYKAATMFIKMEVDAHAAILSELANRNMLFTPDFSLAFPTSSWLGFRSDLVGHIPVGELKQITAYYNSINRICILSSYYSSYNKRKEAIASAYAENKAIFDLLILDTDKQHNHNMLVRICLSLRDLFLRWEKHV